MNEGSGNNKTILKYSDRKMRHVSDMDTIKGMINKYINLNDLHFLNNLTNRPEPVVFLNQALDAEIIMQFPCVIDQEEVRIFSIVSDRYIEFRLANITADDDTLGLNTYRLKLKNCLLAMDKRSYPRITLDTGECSVDNFTVSKYNETAKELSSAVFARILMKEFTDHLEGYETRILRLPDEEQTNEIIFVRKTGRYILCNNEKDIRDFLQENAPLISEKIGPDLTPELEEALIDLHKKAGSFLVMPLDYTSSSGNSFPLAHLIVGRNSSSIKNSDYESLCSRIDGLSEKIRKGNYINQKCRGDVIDISVGGCRVNFPVTDAVKNLLKKEQVIFDLKFDWDEPIRVEGNVKHIMKSPENIFLVGIQFSGSQYGPDFENIINARLKKRKQK